MISDDEIEHVARAIYGTEHDSRGWDQEPGLSKDRFLTEARIAIATLDRLRKIKSVTPESRRLVG
jgi:hypothetical protein